MSTPLLYQKQEVSNIKIPSKHLHHAYLAEYFHWAEISQASYDHPVKTVFKLEEIKREITIPTYPL